MSERGTTKSRYLLCCQKLNPGVLHLVHIKKKRNNAVIKAYKNPFQLPMLSTSINLYFSLFQQGTQHYEFVGLESDI